MKIRDVVVVVGGLVAMALGGGCGGDDDAPKDPITIGLVAPKSGALGAVGASFERVATVAVEEINAKGGVDGHPLVLLVADDMTDATMAATQVTNLIDMGAVAIIGPATSGAVGNAVPIAKARTTPIVSPSSTAPSLAMADDGGYMFRNVPNDDVQGIAMAYYLRQKAMPAVSSVVIVNEDTPYGNGLAGAFSTSFTTAGGAVTDNILFTQNLADAAAADGVVTAIAASMPAPTMVVLVALEQDALKIVQQWDASGMAPGVSWFFTDGARSSGFLVGLPPSIVNSLGTAPTVPITGAAFGVLTTAYNARYDDDISDQVFAANVWDAVYLISSALAEQGKMFPAEPFGGAHLRDSINNVSRGPGQIFHAGQWRDLTSALASGGDVDYDGASGPCDFDENGESIGPYEVWKIVDSGGGTLTFDQELYLEARDIEMLQP